MGGPEIKVPLFQSAEAQPHNGDTQKSQALPASQVVSLFISNFSVVGTRVFPNFRLLGYLALEDIFKGIKQGWSQIYVKRVTELLYGNLP